MAPLSLLERPETGNPLHKAGDLCTPALAAPAAPPTPLARFLLDPMAFASSEAATAAPSFVHAYVQGLDRRLAQILGAPPRLATLAAPPGLSGLAPADPGQGTGAPPGDGTPRLAGAVVLAMAVVAVAVATAAAGAAVVLARRDAN
jgi:hypothetical protein